MDVLARGLLVTALAWLSTGCGFHLRSWDLSGDLGPVLVTAGPHNPLELPLTRALDQAGVEQAAGADEASMIVALLDARQERRSISVSGQARAAEYQLILGVRYQITDAAGNLLVPPQWLERERVFRIDRDNIVASSEEQALLEREMQNDLVQQILRSLNAVAPEVADAA